jgi:hypothetical protein
MKKGITVLMIGFIIGVILIVLLIFTVTTAYGSESSPLNKILGGVGKMVSKLFGFGD